MRAFFFPVYIYKFRYKWFYIFLASSALSIIFSVTWIVLVNDSVSAKLGIVATVVDVDNLIFNSIV